MVVVTGCVVVVVVVGVHDGQSPARVIEVDPDIVWITVDEHTTVLADAGKIKGDIFVSPQQASKVIVALFIPVFSI